MIKAMFSLFKGLINSIILLAFTIACAIPLYIFSLLKLCLAKTRYRNWCTQKATQSVTIWCICCKWLTKFIHGNNITIEGNPELLKNNWYFIISNHQSWPDIMYIEWLLAGKIPFIKFFIKDEFKYIPIIGIATWALDLPAMKRYSRKTLLKKPHLKGKDLETTQKRCEQYLKEPSSVLSFLEGTRFTAKKHKLSRSEYKHLLPPKSAGFAFAIKTLKNHISSILDITIAYPNGKKTFWHFLCGNIGEVKIKINEVPLPQQLLQGCYLTEPATKQNVKQWLNDLWQQKDNCLQKMMQAKNSQMSDNIANNPEKAHN